MKKNWLVIILFALAFFMIYELFNNSFSIFLLVLGVIALLIGNRTTTKNNNVYTLIGFGSFALAILSSRVVLFILVVLLILLIGQFPNLSQAVQNALKKSKTSNSRSEFIMVDFNQTKEGSARVTKNKWFGVDDETTEEIYSWSDVNFSKLAGNTIFDLGNTILPKEQNIILIQKGFGNTKVLVPEGVSVSLDISLLLGEVRIGNENIPLKNETIKWQSETYALSARKIKIMMNQFVGEIEVVFL